ncbi:cold-shock protein [Chryseosolibacter indicus]|uniref:Cold shock domain-containing protein n=1 Tax=Chryseosolibacter indicus TaxID=2782351 RepID=A0ABS5VS38_9BACT|nr:cold shock domain-containing protein [Chryseosolibacter indicus]MBT1702826.1 cold shock domain-containing protein [Chryseosolibacter indicus]
MAKSQETFSKKEKEKKRLQKRKEKEERKAERKANAKEGKTLDEMMAYVDENGNITSTPPDPNKRRTVIKEEDIVLGSRNVEGARPLNVRKGRVTFFNTSKGYGFIKDEQSQESVFVHMNALSAPIQENDKVTFETQMGVKGLSAVNVKKV